MQLMIIDTIDVCDACMFFLNWQVQRIMRSHKYAALGMGNFK